MTTRQVYTRTGRIGTGEALLSSDEDEWQERTTASHTYLGSNRRLGGEGGCSGPRSNDALRAARLDKFQASYDQDRQVFQAKELEKRKKKLEEKLKRYEGIGELGNKMSDHIPQSEKCSALMVARVNQQTQYGQASSLSFQQQQQQQHERSKRETLKNNVSGGSCPSGGQRLGSPSLTSVRGDHPLLARLTSDQ